VVGNTLEDVRRIIGILGGMGPLATVDLEYRIIKYNHKAKRDQDHVPIVVINDPRVPDRTAYIKGVGRDPRPKLIEGIRKLEKVGADIIFIPCNTAHAFYEDLVKVSSIPIYHMPYKTLLEASRNYNRVVLFATLGTYISGVYERANKLVGVDLIIPSNEVKEDLMKIIYDKVKAGKDVTEEEIEKILGKVPEADIIILGCTELSVLKDKFKKYVDVIDPLDVAAMDAIKFSYGEMPSEEILPPHIIKKDE